MYTVYGIPNCDTVKKVKDWLDAHKIKYEFHNYKTEGISAEKLKNWFTEVSWETILNKKSTTWRELDAKTQASITNEKKAIQLLTENTSAIKRPVIEKDGKVVAVGFNATEYEQIFKR